jgi:hypothetical protein
VTDKASLAALGIAVRLARKASWEKRMSACRRRWHEEQKQQGKLLYQQIADGLRQQIICGEIPYGERIDVRNSEYFRGSGSSRSRVMKLLKGEGLVELRHDRPGNCWYSLSPVHKDPPPRWEDVDLRYLGRRWPGSGDHPST